jgi:hypothetical protein
MSMSNTMSQARVQRRNQLAPPLPRQAYPSRAVCACDQDDTWTRAVAGRSHVDLRCTIGTVRSEGSQYSKQSALISCGGAITNRHTPALRKPLRNTSSSDHHVLAFGFLLNFFT